MLEASYILDFIDVRRWCRSTSIRVPGGASRWVPRSASPCRGRTVSCRYAQCRSALAPAPCGSASPLRHCSTSHPFIAVIPSYAEHVARARAKRDATGASFRVAARIFIRRKKRNRSGLLLSSSRQTNVFRVGSSRSKNDRETMSNFRTSFRSAAAAASASAVDGAGVDPSRTNNPRHTSIITSTGLRRLGRFVEGRCEKNAGQAVIGDRLKAFVNALIFSSSPSTPLRSRIQGKIGNCSEMDTVFTPNGSVLKGSVDNAIYVCNASFLARLY